MFVSWLIHAQLSWQWVDTYVRDCFSCDMLWRLAHFVSKWAPTWWWYQLRGWKVYDRFNIAIRRRDTLEETAITERYSLASINNHLILSIWEGCGNGFSDVSFGRVGSVLVLDLYCVADNKWLELLLSFWMPVERVMLGFLRRTACHLFIIE